MELNRQGRFKAYTKKIDDPPKTWRIRLGSKFNIEKIDDERLYAQSIVKALSDEGWVHTKINFQSYLVFKKTFDEILDFRGECEQKHKVENIIAKVQVPSEIEQMELKNFKLIVNNLGFKHHDFRDNFNIYCPGCSYKENDKCMEKNCMIGARNRGQIKMTRRQKGMPYPKIVL